MATVGQLRGWSASTAIWMGKRYATSEAQRKALQSIVTAMPDAACGKPPILSIEVHEKVHPVSVAPKRDSELTS